MHHGLSLVLESGPIGILAQEISQIAIVREVDDEERMELAPNYGQTVANEHGKLVRRPPKH